MVTMLLLGMLIPGLVSCGTKKEEQVPASETEEKETVEVTVFAAASLTETLTEISELYQKECPEVKLIFNFDSSGTLKTQIQEGAECDLFISAGQLQMNQMDSSADKEANTEGLDLVQQDTHIDILENKVTLCVSDENKSDIQSFDDLAAA